MRSVKKVKIKVDERIRIRTNSYGSGGAYKLNGSLWIQIRNTGPWSYYLEPLDDGSLGHGRGEGGHLELNRAYTRAGGEAPAPQLHCPQHHHSDLQYIK